MFLKINFQRFRKNGFDRRAGFRIAELAFGLSFELRIAEFHADDGRESFAHVVAGEVIVFLLQDAFCAGVGVEFARQGCAKANQVRPTFGVINVVREAVHGFVIFLRVLQSNLHVDVGCIVVFEDVEDVFVLGGFFVVEMSDKTGDASFEIECVDTACLFTLIRDDHLDAFREVALLAQVVNDGFPIEDDGFKNGCVWFKRDGCSGAFGFLSFFHFMLRLAELVFLAPDVAVALHLGFHIRRERVDN